MLKYVSAPQPTCYARIELKHTTIRLKDGLSGTAAVNDAALTGGETTTDIDTVALNTAAADLVPVGARFTVAGETGSPVHTVTARTPTSAGPTTNIVFSPALVGATADNSVLTFLPQQIEIKVGDGNLTYTENDEFSYDTDRGLLDTVRRGDEVPLDVALAFVYEFVSTGTNEIITPTDALKGIRGASEWVTSASDPCEPYAVDLEIEHTPPCGGAEKEITLFPDFRPDSKAFDLDGASVDVTGRCNATEPTITRVAQP